MKSLVSNPPYNIKWDPPPFAQLQPRFSDTEIPPKGNANYAFVLTALEWSERSVFILPCAVLSPDNGKEEKIKEWIINRNYLESVILCPDNMFESTSISTCIIVLDKNKDTALVEMVDLRKQYVVETRKQNGQYGGASHTNRVYKKELKCFSDETMDKIIECIQKKSKIEGLCCPVSIEDIKREKYCLLPSRFIEFQEDEITHRSYEDIVSDLNRIIKQKNMCKLTINETIAKNLGFDLELYKLDQKENVELNKTIQKISGQKIEKNNYFSSTKNKNEIKFENGSKESISSILLMILNTWKQHIYFLNTEENRYLAELRDRLIPDLMSGRVSAQSEEVKS